MTPTPELQAVLAALAQAERDTACGITPSGEPLRVALHKATEIIKGTDADLAALRLERDALRAQLAEAKTLGASLHKASAAGYDRCTGDVVAFLRKHAAGMVLVNQHDNVRLRGTCYLNAANMIERAEHVGAKERE